jgi:hypothetical protein
MSVNVKFKGGPLNGRKNTLKGRDKPPATYKCDEEAKAKNMRGEYRIVTNADNVLTEPVLYVWQGHRVDLPGVSIETGQFWPAQA